MQEEQMTCPKCGNKYDPIDAFIDDKGNPVCPNCAAEEE